MWPALTADLASRSCLEVYDISFKIAGTAIASMPGTWTANIAWNGALLKALTFIVGTNLMTNSSFEQPGGNMVTVPAGNPYITGWTVTRGPVVYVSNYFTCSDGKVCIDLAGSTGMGGGVSQTVTTVSGTSYTLTFDFSGNPDRTGVKTMRVLVGGQSFDFSFDTTGMSDSNMGWVTKTIPFTAAGTTTSIEFYDTDAPGYWGPVIDNVRVLAGGASTASCSFAVNPLTASIPGAGGSATVTVTTTTGCAWTASTSTSWITITSGASGTGSGAATYAVSANSGDSSRTGTLTIAGQTHTVTQAAGSASCTYSINPQTAQAPAGGGTGSVMVTAPSGCAWTASNTAGWMTITSGGSGTAGGTVSYSVSPNTGTTSRTGTLNIAGQIFTITQAAGSASCIYSINPQTAQVAAGGGPGSVTVTARSGCAWTASSNATWVTITSGATGSGGGAVSYSVSSNTDTNSRNGTLNIAGQIYTVTQAAGSPSCTYSIDSQSAQVSAGAASGTINVTAQSGCTWTASSNAAWIAITSGASGTGSGAVKYSAAANTSPKSRIGTLTVAGQTFTLAQAAAASTTCTYVLSVPSAQVVSGGGSGSVNVTAGNGCAWTATSNNGDWITITAGATGGSGNGTVKYSAAANTSVSSRAGTMTIAGQTFTLTQPANGAANTPVITGIANWSDGSNWFTPGSRVAITGTGLSATTGSSPALTMPLSLDGVTVWIYDGSQSVNAAVSYVSPSEVDALLPYDLGGSEYKVAVQNGAGTSPQYELSITAQSPYLETDNQVDGAGNAVALHLDATPVTAASPASAGEVVELTVLGLGEVLPAPNLGSLPSDGSAAPLSKVTGPVDATVGGYPAEVRLAALSGFTEYRVQIVVPVQMMPGKYQVQLSCEGTVSQDNVVLPVTSDWETGQTAAISKQGGTVSYGGLTLTVPASSLDAAATVGITRHMVNGDGGTQSQYLITGLPDSGAGPITLSFDTPNASGPVAVTASNLADQNRGPALFPATFSGGHTTLTLPDTRITAPASTGGAASTQMDRRASAGRKARAPVRPGDVYEGGGCSTTTSGASSSCYPAVVQTVIATPVTVSGTCPNNKVRDIFSFYWETYAGDPNPPMDVNQVRRLGDGLLKACQLLSDPNTVNLAWKTRNWPIMVHIFTFPDAYKDRWGMEGDLMWGKAGQGIDVNKRFFTADNMDLMTVTLGHELFHVLQNQYDARSGPGIATDSTGGPWLWYDEAASTWFERRVAIQEQLFNNQGASYIPTTVKPDLSKADASSENYMSIEMGLGNIQGLTRSQTQERGYGAAMFLEYMSTKGSLADIAQQFSGNDPFSDNVLPVDSLRKFYTDAGLSQKWEDYCQAFVQGQIYPGFPDTTAILGLAGDHQLMLQKSPSISWAGQARPLSAQFYLVNFTGAKIAADQQIIIRLAADEQADVKMAVFRMSGAGSTRQLTELSYGQAQFTVDTPQDLAATGNALLIMVVNPAVDVSAAATPYTVSVGSGGFTKIIFRLKLPSGLVEVDNSPNVPLTWTGSSFKASSPVTQWSDYWGNTGSSSYSFSGQLTPATGANAPDYLDNLHVHLEWHTYFPPGQPAVLFGDVDAGDDTGSFDVVFTRLSLGSNGTYGSLLVRNAIQSLTYNDHYVDLSNDSGSFIRVYDKDSAFPSAGSFPSNTISVELDWF